MLAVALAAAVLARPAGIPAAWTEVRTGPAGGSVWQGRIPDSVVPWDTRPSAVYLPPGYPAAGRYPIVYLLHGMRGNPSSIWDGLQLADVADGLIAAGRAHPFIAVMPVAGPVVDPNGGEWAGVWEDYVVQDVVPWVDAHLPALPGRGNRALEGLSSGGYGAVDIGLRHPGLFGTLGSWAGYFAPVFHDGPFAHASAADLAAHDPVRLVRRKAATLRRDRVRFYLSVGGNHGAILRRWTIAFAQELSSLRLSHELWLLPRADSGHFWQATLPSALLYAESRPG